MDPLSAEGESSRRGPARRRAAASHVSDGEIARRPAAAVPASCGEPARRALMAAGLLARDLVPGRSGDLLLLPLTEGAAGPEVTAALEGIGESPPRVTLTEHAFIPAGSRRGSYRELIDLPPELMALLPRAFDVVGDIAVVKLGEELIEHSGRIGRALLEAHGNIRLVAADKGVGGEFRVRDLQLIAGEGEMRTRHREGGLTLHVDLSAAYFSPRLAHERERVVEAVREAGDEVVLDMFAGVGPFAIAVARHTGVRRVVAVDKNPAAVRLLEENAGANGVADRVDVRAGDAGEVVPALTAEAGGPFAARVIMNHPHGALPFLAFAVAACTSGGTVHYHEMVERDALEGRGAAIMEEVSRGPVGAAAQMRAKVEGRRVVRTYSASTDHVCFDIRVL